VVRLGTAIQDGPGLRQEMPAAVVSLRLAARVMAVAAQLEVEGLTDVERLKLAAVGRAAAAAAAAAAQQT
jgi:hypothetical protein